MMNIWDKSTPDNSRKRSRSEVSPLFNTSNKMSKSPAIENLMLSPDTPPWATLMYAGITAQFDALGQQVGNMEKKHSMLEKRVETLENNTSARTIRDMEHRIQMMEDKFLYQECQMRKNNIVFHGLKETSAWETEATTEQQVRSYITNVLKTDNTSIMIDKTYRTGSRSNKPRGIVVRFSGWEDKQIVWKARLKDQYKLDQFLSQDFPPDIRKRRRRLIPILNAAKAIDKYRDNSYITVDKLVINGRSFTIYNLGDLPSDLDPHKIATPEKGGFTFFWGNQSPLSNHFPCKFELGGKEFNCNEQHQMYQKALHANDKTKMGEIMSTDDPVKQLNIGKLVVVPNKAAWNKLALGHMRKGLSAKFNQNLVLRDFLLSTRDTEIVESSPRDLYWGIGMTAMDPLATDKTKWKGENNLGILLTELRDSFKHDNRLT